MESSTVQNDHLVSIVMPVYNCEPFLRQCLDSVLSQTYQNWELLCIDDGSKDGSYDVLMEYASTDSRIKALSHSNMGPGKTRNAGIDLAQGDYYLFLDADDFIEPCLLERAVSRAVGAAADIVVWDIWFYNDKFQHVQHPPVGILHFAPFLERREVFSWRDSPDNILLSFQNWPWNKLFSAHFVRSNGLRFQEDVRRTEDVMFVCAALMKADRIAAVDGRLTYYRMMRPGSAMATKDLHSLDFLKALHNFKVFLQDADLYERVLSSYRNWALSSALYNLHTLNDQASFEEVFYHLKNRGFADLELSECVACDFSNRGEFEAMQRILKESSSDYLFYRMTVLTHDVDDGIASSDYAYTEARATISELNARLVEQGRALDIQRERNVKLAGELHETRAELDAVLNAAEQKVGTALCKFPRFVQRSILERKG